MYRFLRSLVVLSILVSTPAWAITAQFTPYGPGGPSTLSASWNMATLAFTIQGYYGQGFAPASWIVDATPVYQDIHAWFSLQGTLHPDGTLEPGGLVQLSGFSPAASPQHQLLFQGALLGKTERGSTWHFPCSVQHLAEPFNGQAGFPSTCDVSFYGDPAWTWDPFSLSGEPVITFTSTPNPVPEPGTWLLLLTGLAGVLGYGYARRRKD